MNNPDGNSGTIVDAWLAAYRKKDHAAMADCYHEQATFADIAFELDGRNQIHAMWHMICENGIRVTVDQPPTRHGEGVVAKITDTYRLSDTDREVVNPITCHFRLQDGLIIQQRDECDAKSWARQAFGVFKGWIVGRCGLLRRIAARKKIQHFIAQHPQYR